MGVSHLYKDFGTSQTQAARGQNSRSEVEQEDDMLQSFEDGYKSGWDDAVAAQSESKTAISAEFGRNLQEASFSYHEARTSLARELKKLFEPLVNSVLPSIAKEALSAHLLDKISELSSEALDQKVEISVSPSQAPALQELCENTLNSTFEIFPDETIEKDQIFFRIGEKEHQIELDTWIENVHGIVSDFFDQIEKGVNNA